MERSVTSRFAARPRWSTDDIRSKIEKSRVVVFTRGEEGHPRCGYSSEVVSALKRSGANYELVDVSGDPSAGAALRAFAGNISFPALYVDGQLVGDGETMREVVASGTLQKKLSC